MALDYPELCELAQDMNISIPDAITTPVRSTSSLNPLNTAADEISQVLFGTESGFDEQPTAAPTQQHHVDDNRMNTDSIDNEAVPAAANAEVDVIQQFMDLSGYDRESAQNYLEVVLFTITLTTTSRTKTHLTTYVTYPQAFGFDLDSAMAVFFGQEGGSVGAHNSSRTFSRQHRSTDTNNNPFFDSQSFSTTLAPDGTTTTIRTNNRGMTSITNVPLQPDGGDGIIDDLLGTMNEHDMLSAHGLMARDIRSFLNRGNMMGMGNFDPFDPVPMRKVDSYDAEGIRKPDPVRQQVLVRGGTTYEDDEEAILARADDPSIEWLFEPPRHLTFMGSLERVSSCYTMFLHRFCTTVVQLLYVTILSYVTFLKTETK